MAHSLKQPTRWYGLHDLEVPSALQLLIEAAEGLEIGSRRCLAEAVGMNLKRAQSGAALDLYVPETGDLTGEERQWGKPMGERLKSLYARSTQKAPQNCGPLEDPPPTLARKLATVLLLPPEQVRDKPAQRLPGEWLLVSEPGLPVPRARKILEGLALHATTVDWAAGKMEDGEVCYLFRVKDDSARQSNFQALTPLLQLDAVAQLAGFEAGGWQVYLPDQAESGPIQPGDRVLGLFCELVRLTPGLCRPDEAGPAAGPVPRPLLALCPSGLAGGGEEGLGLLRAHYLNNLGFSRHFWLDEELHPGTTVRFQDLRNSAEAKAGLVEEMKNHEGYQGYRLELRSTRQIWGDYAQERDLEEQRDFLDYKLHLLRAARQPRPTLLRFSQSQLPAMACVLRSTPMKQLQDQRIFYGFFADQSPPASPEVPFTFPLAGSHYLLYEQGWGLLDGHDPLLDWAQPSQPPLKFWLDPFWARYYPAADGVNSLVFVPEGHALFPTMHGWDARDMDAYLRQTLHDLLPDPLKRSGLGEKPIYIFDRGEGSDALLRISVLDRDQFVPFDQCLSWLNDHIVTHDALEASPTFFQSMARASETLVLARALKAEAKDYQKALTDQTAQARAEIERGLTETLRDLDQAIEQYSSVTGQLLLEARAFHEQHAQLQTYLAGLKRETETLERAFDESRGAAVEATTRFAWTEEAVKGELQAIARRRSELEERINQELAQLQAARERLTKRLLRLF